MPKPKPVFTPDTPIAEFLPLSTHVSPTVLKTTGRDFPPAWRLGGLPFVGREKTIRKQNGLGIFATQSPEDALASDIAAALIEQTATMILLPNPNASREDYVDGLKLTDAEYQVVVSLDERSRCFLVKQGHASAVCQLNLRGMDDALAVISASTDNIEIMHDVLNESAAAEGVTVDELRPEQWLARFYESRKGSGKPKPNLSSRSTPSPRSASLQPPLSA
ncbi:hypothetical protein RLIN73S_03819 [Rhodanobacter lindaniclasticus]